jgi:hypothetical protein
MLAARRDAIAICQSCPALAQCRRYYFDELDPNARPFGVVGGVVNPPKDIAFAPRRRRRR